MIQRTEIEQARANLLKVARSAIRLKYSIMADEALNRTLPDLEKEFTDAIHRGELPDPVQLRDFLDD